MIFSLLSMVQAVTQWEKHEKMNNLYVKRMQSVPCSLYSQAVTENGGEFYRKRGCGNRKLILMTFKRFSLSSTGQELKVIRCLGIYCWFVCASGVWKKNFPAPSTIMNFAPPYFKRGFSWILHTPIIPEPEVTCSSPMCIIPGTNRYLGFSVHEAQLDGPQDVVS